MSLKLTDLRNITRNSKQCKTTVKVQMVDWDSRSIVDWLIFGEVRISKRKEGLFDLDAYLTEGVTDFEHDSAYAFRLPLIGLQLDEMCVHYHTTHLMAWINPNDDDGNSFRVPRPDYNPMKLKDAVKCKSKDCDDKGHIIVPEGHYLPPFDEELYNQVKGKRVHIRIGPTRENE